MKLENTEVTGFENAILGARLPMCKDLEEAREKSDSCPCGNNCHNCSRKTLCNNGNFYIGNKDLDLLKRLINADDKIGQPNSKFLRMIHAQVCITAPLYWWKEMDTYKVGTTANSTSTMHRIANYPITMDCFEMDDFENIYANNENYNGLKDYPIFHFWEDLCGALEYLRVEYNETIDKKYWKELIRILPESWLQTRMFDCDYATLRNIYCWRVKIPHKLTEWKQFGDWVESLPYAQDLICS